MTTSLISSLGFVRIACLSPRVRVADVTHNVQAIIHACEDATVEGAEILVLPELCITGYTLGDLVRMPDLLSAARHGLEQIRIWSTGRTPLVAVGLPLELDSRLYNCAAIVHDGHVKAIIPKTYLPTTREYYDARWYVSGAEADASTIRIGRADVPFGADLILEDGVDSTIKIGVELCEDLWAVEPPSGRLAMAGATLIINLSASNEVIGKARYRRDLVVGQSARTYTAYAYASSGPGESTTDTVYSGHCLVAECGQALAEGRRLQLNGTMVVADVDLQRCVTDRLNANSFSQLMPPDHYRRVGIHLERTVKTDVRRQISPLPFVPAGESDRAERCQEIVQLQATALSVRMQHTGAKRIVLGVSGGLDSTLALLVCEEVCDILGLDRAAIVGVSMPGFGTTARTRDNARRLLERVGAEFREIDITVAVQHHFNDIGHAVDDHSVVFENAQARERTQILMDIANQVSGLLVGTGDMSELALGWCTFNADHMAMYNVNSGVPKTLVKHLIAWFAETRADAATREALTDILNTPISPELLPPSAEGGIAQRTEELLGPYEVHDFFLFEFVRMQRPIHSVAILAMIAFDGTYSANQVLNWLSIFVTRFFSQQFKRSSQPDGVKIGSVALSPRADWRMPSDARVDVWRAELESLRSLVV